jgi:hypothetical protein
MSNQYQQRPEVRVTCEPLQQPLRGGGAYLRHFAGVEGAAEADVHVVGEQRAVGAAGGERRGRGPARATRAQQFCQGSALHALCQLARPRRLLLQSRSHCPTP